MNSTSFVPSVSHMSVLLDCLPRYPRGKIVCGHDVLFAQLANNVGVSYRDKACLYDLRLA